MRIYSKLAKRIVTTLAFLFLINWNAYAIDSANGLSANGSTGLIVTPTASTLWENSGAGLAIGYHMINAENNESNIFHFTLGFLNRLELGGTLDMQKPENSDDVLLHAKFRFYPWSGRSYSSGGMAIGVNYQMLEQHQRESKRYQVYWAISWPGNLFGAPAETTAVIGKTNDTKDNIDFSIGYSLSLFPSALKNYVFWITDFSNYTYSVQGVGAHTSRGIFNTGLRLNILKGVNKFMLNIDILGLDLLDENREFGLGISFGLSF